MVGKGLHQKLMLLTVFKVGVKYHIPKVGREFVFFDGSAVKFVQRMAMSSIAFILYQSSTFYRVIVKNVDLKHQIPVEQLKEPITLNTTSVHLLNH